MNFFTHLFDFIIKLFSLRKIEREQYHQKIAELEVEVKNKEEEIEEFVHKVNQLEKEIEQYKENPKKEYYDDKYPKVDVEYRGRTFGTSKEIIPIDVRLLITPQDFHIKKDIEKNNLFIENPEIDIPKIYKFIKKKYYKYVYDIDNYGITEYWEFPFEILEKKRKTKTAGFDCDSWANFQASYYIAAGMPSWKVRVVVGNCKICGHSTVYVFSEKDNRFHHLNSTYGRTDNEISNYPTTDDANTTDDFGIRNVWFSFNNEFAWCKFTSEAKKSYNKYEKKKDYIIRNSI